MDWIYLYQFIIRPESILQISLAVLLILRFGFKIKYISCFDLVVKHLLCFKKANGKISLLSIFMYFGIPIFIAYSLVQIRCIDEESINIITIIISILTSMFFTLLTLVVDMRKKIQCDKVYSSNDAAISEILLKETYYSVMFEILLSIVILCFCFINLFSEMFSNMQSFFIYYFTFVVVTNLFMILKRIYRVIDKDMNSSK